jgi:hypothetical protein
MMNRSLAPLLFVAATLMANSNAHAQCTANSGAQRATLVELYTSEGCDSCPPADRWLSTLKTRNDVVPLAFHVDYWDYIGWKDRYAQPQFGKRHRARVSAQGGGSVHTPQILFNGRDSDVWRSEGRAERALSELHKLTSSAVLSLAVTKVGASAVAVSVESQPVNAAQQFHFALTQSNVVSNVTAGENKGVSLKQDYIVRAFQSASQPRAQLNVPAGVSLDDLSVSVIAETKSGEYVQAVTKSLKGC